MKRNTLYNKSIMGTGLAAMLLFSACVKNFTAAETDFSNLQPVVLIPEGGIAAFGSQALNFPPDDEADTVYFRVNYASVNVAPSDLKISIAIDNDAMTSYNAGSEVKYKMFPNDIYTFTTTEATVKKGESYSDPIAVIVHPNKVDPTQNYMLPISIKTAPGNSIISGNFGTIYLHFIGNAVAGTYNGTGTRYNYLGSTSYSYPGPYPAPASTLALAPYYPKVAAPDDPHTVEIPYVNLGAPYNLVVTMDDDLNITSVEPNATLAGILSGFTVHLATYDKATKTFHFITQYNNAPDGTGNDRIAEETLVHQ